MALLFWWDLWEASSTGSFTQAAATWSANESEAVPGTAVFDQAAATWAAVELESIPATASWAQAAAVWAAAASEGVGSTAAFVQAAAAWAAVVSEAETGTASWAQAAAAWDAVGLLSAALGPSDVRGRQGGLPLDAAVVTHPAIRRRTRQAIRVRIEQAPATFAAALDVDDDEAALLVLLLEAA